MLLYKQFYRTSTAFKPASRSSMFKNCETCKHQIKVIYGNVVSNRCMKFMFPLKDGTVIYEQTTTMRNDQQKCGPYGEFYTDNSVEQVNNHPYSKPPAL